ncbi:MAG: Gfo/Idh/MocA family oxidoreductase [Burkholderiaceae bacterium]
MNTPEATSAQKPADARLKAPVLAPVKAAVIGAGWYAAQSHIPTLAARPDVILDGVCRLGVDPLEKVRAHFGFAFASEDYRAVLARKPQVVVVASPHARHFEHCMAALAAGAHVLCEKPMTLDPAQAWMMESTARQAGLGLVMANGYHYLAGLTQVRQALLEGAVGRIEHVSSSFVSATRAVFEGDVGLARWNTHFFRPSRSTWQDPENGGGFAYGQLSHSVALTLWLTGLNASAVSAHNYCVEGNDLCNAASVLCQDGAVVSLSGAAAMPEGQRALLRLLVTGTGGVMEIELDRDRAVLHRHDGANRDFGITPGQWAYHCEGPVHALVDMALGNGVNLTPGSVGAATVAVIAALQASSRNAGASAVVFQP